MTNQEIPIPDGAPLPAELLTGPDALLEGQSWMEAARRAWGEANRRDLLIGDRVTHLVRAVACIGRHGEQVEAELAELRDDFIRYSGPHEMEDGKHSPAGGPLCVCGAPWRYYGCEWLAEKVKTRSQLAQLREVEEVYGATAVAGVQHVEANGPASASDVTAHTLTIPFLPQDLDRLIAAAQVAGVDAVTFAGKAVLAAILEVETGGGL